MFLFNIETIITEVQSFYPKMLKNVDLAIKESTPDLDFIRLNEKYFNKVNLYQLIMPYLKRQIKVL